MRDKLIKLIGDAPYGCRAMKKCFYDETLEGIADYLIANGVTVALEAAPTIDAEPVKHGVWVHDINNLYGCSECLGRETMSHKKLKAYCPNCGAKMDGEKDNDTY